MRIDYSSLATSRSEIERQARRLVAYWAARGAIVNVVVDFVELPSVDRQTRRSYYLKSDMVNGLPVNWSEVLTFAEIVRRCSPRWLSVRAVTM